MRRFCSLKNKYSRTSNSFRTDKLLTDILLKELASTVSHTLATYSFTLNPFHRIAKINYLAKNYKIDFPTYSRLSKKYLMPIYMSKRDQPKSWLIPFYSQYSRRRTRSCCIYRFNKYLLLRFAPSATRISSAASSFR